MIKIITGAPRSGKTFWAVRHILLTYFYWCEELFEWKSKSDIAPIVITNIDGLKVPHVSYEKLVKDEGCTIHEFMTLEKVIPFYEREKRPIVFLMDEAHGLFPFNYKDKSLDQNKSCLFFFGYHGHYPIDMYMMVQNWNDLSPSIAQRAEYQIDAERRSMTISGEFRYHYLHPKTLEKLNTQVIKPDKKIFQAYLSTSSGEHKSNEIRPMRKLFLMIAGFAVLGVILAGYFIHRMLPKNKVTGPAHVQAAGAGVKSEGMKRVMSVSDYNKLKGVVRPDLKKSEYVTVTVGGAWLGGKLVAIDLFGDVMKKEDIPFSYTVDNKERKVSLVIPCDMLASLRKGVWIDGNRRLDGSKDENRTPAIPLGENPAQKENNSRPVVKQESAKGKV